MMVLSLGVDTSGWYFSDEGQIFRGPYASLIDCANARDEYIEVLMKASEVFFTETTSPQAPPVVSLRLKEVHPDGVEQNSDSG